MNKIAFKFSISIATALLIFMSCKKTDNTNNNSVGSNNTGTTAPPAVFGGFYINSTTFIAYGSNPPTYSFSANAATSSIIGLSINGYTFTTTGNHYNNIYQNGKCNDTIIWNLVGIASNFHAKNIPIIQEIVGDSFVKFPTKAYKTPCYIPLCDTFSAQLQGTQKNGYGWYNSTRDSIVFDVTDVNDAMMGYTGTNPHPILGIQITCINYRDTVINGKQYRFSSRKTMQTHCTGK